MSILWCGVNVRTNQEYYKVGDVAVITVKSEGYLLNPSINQVEIWAGAYPVHRVPEILRTGYVRVVQPITNDMATNTLVTSPTYIKIIYTPQVWWSSRQEYVDIIIIP
jgi:hypothetical protein